MIDLIQQKNDPFCNIYDCSQDGYSYGFCSIDECTEGNLTCKAVSCINSAEKGIIVPYCSQNLNSYVYEQEFQNVSDYKFINGILTQVRFTPSEMTANNNMWIYVGAGCGGAVVLILVVAGVCICMKKKRGKNRNIKSSQPLKKITTTKTKRVMGEKQVLLLQ
ncbi:Hypothetical_protein [Hexamita inflata]|uniref:Hypothetical_protein n=1 Tax=Hexamita inflata TaxID=28002 RepID=A0AA86QX79_9EUKA|nr:Hypothetical protein HINF_LOCUS55369 [Hexamita inflata]